MNDMNAGTCKLGWTGRSDWLPRTDVCHVHEGMITALWTSVGLITCLIFIKTMRVSLTKNLLKICPAKNDPLSLVCSLMVIIMMPCFIIVILLRIFTTQLIALDAPITVFYSLGRFVFYMPCALLNQGAFLEVCLVKVFVFVSDKKRQQNLRFAIRWFNAIPNALAAGASFIPTVALFLDENDFDERRKMLLLFHAAMVCCCGVQAMIALVIFLKIRRLRLLLPVQGPVPTAGEADGKHSQACDHYARAQRGIFVSCLFGMTLWLSFGIPFMIDYYWFVFAPCSVLVVSISLLPMLFAVSASVNDYHGESQHLRNTTRVSPVEDHNALSVRQIWNQRCEDQSHTLDVVVIPGEAETS